MIDYHEYIREWEPYTGDRSELPPIPAELED